MRRESALHPDPAAGARQGRLLTTVLAVLALLGATLPGPGSAAAAEPAAGKVETPVKKAHRATDCGWAAGTDLKAVPDLQARLDAYRPTPLDPDLGHLDSGQTLVLQKLVEAAKVIHEIFAEQATPCLPQLRALIDGLPQGEREAAARYFQINLGPWDRRFHFEPFFGSWPHPEGANYYPLDLTAAEKAAIADAANGLDGLFTMVRRDEAGALAAVPYSAYFAEELRRAAGLLREAADLTSDPTLRAFLVARAEAFLSDDYYASDMLWMDLDGPVEITIGPYETYEDGLFGYKAAFEAFVTVTDPQESARLASFKDELPWLESQLPIPDRHKNLARGSESPIRVVDEVYSAGDTRAGIQTIAFNLPNDERVREAKGSKKVLLRNVMNAKFEQILLPIAEVLVAESQLADLTAESFFLHTLWHEMSHGLGPGKIVKDGRETEVRLELKDTYSTLEEAKADAMGEWDIFVLARAGRVDFPAEIYRRQAATYLAGLFRSVRFGVGEAHGQANAIQFNYLTQKGAIVHDPATGRFAVDAAALERAIAELVTEICLIQAEGDYAASQAFIARYGGLTPPVQEALRKLQDIPVDIQPVFSRYDP